ncbi:hypothetical protein TRAPUB_8571 [Trametes pubescens]|uniref:Uncharacterized protein n=1 Tax=Trametes pubescens TaxID=154538 RepID=A0A1M2W4T6_TRAPU|nr:hypothetical protein TRAPUB_8571 [Trametes pubescens]
MWIGPTPQVLLDVKMTVCAARDLTLQQSFVGHNLFSRSERRRRRWVYYMGA